MKEQEKGDGSDGKESLKTKSDESGEEKNGDDDNQKSAQKKKGKAEAGGDIPQAVSPFPTHRQVEASSAFPGGFAAGHDPSAGTAVRKSICRLQVSFSWEQVEQGPSRGRPGACLPMCSMVAQNPSLWVVSAVVDMWAQSGLSLGRQKQAEEGQVL